jgi:hypothetical protein
VTVDGSGVATIVTTPALVSVKSRKVHAGVGIMDLAIDSSQPINGAITVEPRVAGHQVVFTFSAAVTVAGTASMKDAANNDVGSVSTSVSGNEVVVTLGGISNGQRVTVGLSNVNNAGVNASASIGFLAGDVSQTRSVTASDILRVKGRGGAASADNFLHDIDLSGTIDAIDVSAAKSGSGLSLP